MAAGWRPPGGRGTRAWLTAGSTPGVTDAVWAGISAAVAATAGMIFLGDPVSAGKLVSIGLVLAGVVGLNLSGATL